MHESKDLQDTVRAIKGLPLKQNVRFERTILYNKRLAPKGHVFFVVSSKVKGKRYSMFQLVPLVGSTPEKEEQLKEAMTNSFLGRLEKL